ncbi:MAG TPA: class I SAM-dependent methyltransferase [Burkholderiales bacterium]|nr:class I SAM-dependent methyltransferase [Burkholderiales bacterium]
MLRSLLKSVFATHPASGPQAPAPAGLKKEISPRFEAAYADWRAGRAHEAVAACRELLELSPNYSPAHNLLALIELPGEDYVRMLERVHAHLRPRTYLEIGVSRGDSIRLAGPGTRAIGVDPQPEVVFPLGPNASVVEETSDEFFAGRDVRAELGGLPVDLAFIDGMHQFEFALRDFMNIEALCAPSSTILVHDVYPMDERTAARERVTTFWSGDIWRLVLLLRKHRPDLVVRTIAAPPTGLAVVRNLDPGSTYIRDRLDALVAEYLAVDFSALASGKAEQLAVVPNDWSQVRALLDAPVSSGR